MEIEEKIYRTLCSISKKCKDYFFINKNVGLNHILDQDVDKIIELSKKLEKLREEQIKEYESE